MSFVVEKLVLTPLSGEAFLLSLAVFGTLASGELRVEETSIFVSRRDLCCCSL